VHREQPDRQNVNTGIGVLRQKWELGRTHRQVAASVGLSLGAVALTLGRATGAGLDWAVAQTLSDALLEERLYGARDEARTRATGCPRRPRSPPRASGAPATRRSAAAATMLALAKNR
jgi:hypothetical protein